MKLNDIPKIKNIPNIASKLVNIEKCCSSLIAIIVIPIPQNTLQSPQKKSNMSFIIQETGVGMVTISNTVMSPTTESALIPKAGQIQNKIKPTNLLR